MYFENLLTNGKRCILRTKESKSGGQPDHWKYSAEMGKYEIAKKTMKSSKSENLWTELLILGMETESKVLEVFLGTILQSK